MMVELKKKDPRPLIFLNPGEVYATKQDCVIETVLGSCVAVALWDPILKVGGMNHIVLSGINSRKTDGSARFAVKAMEMLAQKMERLLSKKSHWKAFVAGGASQFNNNSYPIGMENVLAAKQWLIENHIHIKFQDVGGENGRLIKFEPHTGKIKLKVIQKRKISSL